jgi:hypothetical protein
MKSFEQDGGECQRKWHSTRRSNLLRLAGKPPRNLCVDEFDLIVCCRYAEFLVKNSTINRYLTKHHLKELRKLENLIGEFEKMCRFSI